MKHLPTACLLLLLCLLAHRASSQAIAPLTPTVVRLEVGDVVHRTLIGLDTATYRSTRLYVASAGHLLDVRASRITTLERSAGLADSLQAAYATELRRCRASQAATEADYDRMRQAARVALASPPRPPWLLDGRTYKGVAFGAVAVLLIKLFVLR